MDACVKVRQKSLEWLNVQRASVIAFHPMSPDICDDNVLKEFTNLDFLRGISKAL